MQIDIKYVIGQRYEQVVLLSSKIEETMKENSELKAAAKKQQEAP